jgi:hypothetical protein
MAMKYDSDGRDADGRTSAGAAARAPRAAAIAALVASVAVATATRADEFTQHAAHEHGKATLDVAVDGGVVEIRLDSPAVNVLGFEHAPRTPAEKQAVDAAAALLGARSGPFAFPVAAKCGLVSAELRAPDWRTPGEHADYEARWKFSCAAPAALAFVDATFVTSLQLGTQIDANVVTDTLQTRQALRAGALRVRLK